MKQPIVDFDRDEAGDWRAILACGHRQHLRHRPPFINRPWVTTEDGRLGQLGLLLDCRLCDNAAIAPDDRRQR